MRARALIILPLLFVAQVALGGLWIGGIKTADNRVHPIALELNRRPMAKVWLRDGQLRVSSAS